MEPGPRGAQLFTLGGAASYALYLIHAPLGGVLNQFFTAYGRPKGSILLAVSFIAVVAVISVLVERFYDRPVRRWITGLTSKRPRDADKNPVSASAPG